MVDQSIFQMLLKRLESYESSQRTYSFTAIAEFDDPEKEDFILGRLVVGSKLFNDHILDAEKTLKPNRIRVIIYTGAQGKNEESNTIIRVTKAKEEKSSSPAQEPREEKSSKKEKNLNERLDELLSKIDSDSHEKIRLNGIINDSKIDEITKNYQKDLLIFKHDLALQKKDREISELKKQIGELEDEIEETTNLLGKFQGQIEKEGRLESSARDITSIAKGIFSVAPGLIKVAEKHMPGLGGIAKALIDDSLPTDQPEPGIGGGLENAESENPRITKIKTVIEYCQSLSDEDMDKLLMIIESFEKNPGSLSDYINIINQNG